VGLISTHKQQSTVIVLAFQPNFAWRFPAQLSRAGLVVHAVTTRNNLLRHAHGVSRVDLVSDLRMARDLAKILREHPPAFILPTDDVSAEVLRKLHAEPDLAALIEFSVGDPASYDILASKTELMAHAVRIGLAVPRSLEVHNRAEFDAYAAAFMPGALKRDGSWGGIGVAPFRSMKEAAWAWYHIAKPLGVLSAVSWCLENQSLFPVMMCIRQRRASSRQHIQAWVAGRVIKCGMLCRDGEVLAVITFVALRMRGTTGPSSVMEIIERPQVNEIARVLVADLKLSGAYGLDFVEDPQTGQPLLIEVNPRAVPVMALGAVEGAPFDFAGILAQSLGLTAQPVPPLPNRIIAVFPDEWQRDANSPYLKSDWHNVPWDQPDVIRAILASHGAGRRYRKFRDWVKRLLKPIRG